MVSSAAAESSPTSWWCLSGGRRAAFCGGAGSERSGKPGRRRGIPVSGVAPGGAIPRARAGVSICGAAGWSRAGGRGGGGSTGRGAFRGAICRIFCATCSRATNGDAATHGPG